MKGRFLANLEVAAFPLLHFRNVPELRGSLIVKIYLLLSTSSPAVALRSITTPSIGDLISSCFPSNSGLPQFPECREL